MESFIREECSWSEFWRKLLVICAPKRGQADHPSLFQMVSQLMDFIIHFLTRKYECLENTHLENPEMFSLQPHE